MKNPNGYGCVYNLGGKRRKPFAVRVTNGWLYDKKTDTRKQQFKNIGYYATRQEAMIALAEYNKSPYDLDAEKTTLAEVYEKWSDVKFTEVSHSNVLGYKAAWKLCEPIQEMRMVDIRLEHLQKIADNSGKNAPTLKKYKILLKALFDYAVKYDLLTEDRNKVKYLDFSKAGNPNSYDRQPFSKKDIKRLWDTYDTNEYITVILILIYSGCRISELLELKKENINLNERYFNVVESKTDAGIRTVPIAKKIVPFLEYWYNKNECEFLISTSDGEPMTYRNYYDSYWKPLLKTLDMEKYTPHCTRHTCVSLLTGAKVDERFIQKIVGHKGQNVTRVVYTHLEIEELITEIDKI